MASDKSEDLFPNLLSPEGTQYINDRCVLRTQDGLRVVLVSGISLAHYAVGDYMAEAHAMVSLVNQGWADQNDVARAFGCSVRTLRRHQRRFDEGGLPSPEIKYLTNLVKMVAYQAETDLLRTVAPHYRRVRDEGRTLIQAALLSAADLEVTETELRGTLVPQSSPHRTRAIAALCNELNSLGTLFPGSRLRLRYAIHGTP
jgi:transposase-like protein